MSVQYILIKLSLGLETAAQKESASGTTALIAVTSGPTSPPFMFFMPSSPFPFLPFLFFFFLQQHFLMMQKQQVRISMAATTAMAMMAQDGTGGGQTDGQTDNRKHKQTNKETNKQRRCALAAFFTPSDTRRRCDILASSLCTLRDDQHI